jgi:crotonobetaine/carnitine-CoA ligase
MAATRAQALHGDDLWPSAPAPTASPTDVRAVLEQQASTIGERAFVTYGGETLSFGELDRRVNRVATALAATGLGPGDKVALLMRNSLEFLYSWFALAKLGAVMVPINTSMKGGALQYILEHAGVDALLADDDLAAAVSALSLAAPLRWTFTREYSGQRPSGADTFDALLLGSASPPAPVALEAGTPLSIIYTSGTTGMPKGVVLPHYSYVNTGRYYGEHLHLGPEDRMHTCLPLFHCNAQQTTTMSALVGGRHLSLDERFSLSRFWSWMHDSQATVTNLMGTMLTLLYKQDASELDRGHNLGLVVSAPIPVEFYRQFEERFGVKLLEGYGLTETGTMCVTNPVDDVRPGTLGLPIAHTEARIVDDEGRDAPAGVTGEIIARPTTKYVFMSGYYRDEAATAAAVRDGWFHSGDLGVRREDGYFVYLDRKKDMIRRRGENISSFMLEKLLCDHPAILEAAAIGVSSDLSEEDVLVYLVVRPGSEIGPEEIATWSADAIPDFMQPRFIKLVPELPKTETGRVEKYVLRERGVDGAWDKSHGTGR